MTMQYDEGKPSPEYISHHGVKGMKWGHRKASPSTSDIKDARARQGARVADVNQNTNRLNLSVNGSKQQASLAKKVVEGRENVNKNPDAAVAARMTRGEKAVALLIGGPLGLVVIGANKAVVKSIEKNNKN